MRYLCSVLIVFLTFVSCEEGGGGGPITPGPAAAIPPVGGPVSTTGNFICDGSANSCFSLNGAECTAQTGCNETSTADSCSGVSSSCYSQFSQFSCSNVQGCYWSTFSNSCNGVSYGCYSLFSLSSCISQPGCNWSGASVSCTGVSSSCETFADSATCATQKGCGWRTECSSGYIYVDGACIAPAVQNASWNLFDSTDPASVGFAADTSTANDSFDWFGNRVLSSSKEYVGGFCYSNSATIELKGILNFSDFTFEIEYQNHHDTDGALQVELNGTNRLRRVMFSQTYGDVKLIGGDGAQTAATVPFSHSSGLHRLRIVSQGDLFELYMNDLLIADANIADAPVSKAGNISISVAVYGSSSLDQTACENKEVSISIRSVRASSGVIRP